jgi:acyl-[acyl carrier protein]--UDP-N-acetylglucosamine O-acyltransferase
MFTGNTLSLKKFCGTLGLEVLRDCNFAFVGKIPTRLDARIVPCQKREHVEQAVMAGGVVGVVTTKDLVDFVPASLGLAVSDNPSCSILLLQDYISELSDFQWKSFESRIHSSVVIGEGAVIAKRDVEISEGCVILPNAVVLPRSIIGPYCSIGPGTIVGTDAFEVNPYVSPQRIVRQSGGVRLGAYVDIQAKCTIVRSSFGGFTEVGQETKFDCQVHFAHDCMTGHRVKIAACAEISGRVSIGDDSFIGPNVSISNGVKVGSCAKVTIGAVVTQDVSDGGTVSGNFAVDHKKWLDFMRSVR